MYHSITIGNIISAQEGGAYVSKIVGKNTWNDWGLVPTSRPIVNPPAQNKNAIEIPGTNGSINMSYLLTGHMTYKNRTGSWEFIVENKNIDIGPYKRGLRPDDWTTAYTTIMSYLHGRIGTCVLEDDPAYYYEGSFGVNSWKSDKAYSTIVIDYDLDPFKRLIQASDEPWLWDPFNFEVDYIRELGYWNNGTWYKDITVDQSLTLYIPSFTAPGNYDITCSAPMTLTINGTRVVNLSTGITRIRNLYINYLVEQNNTFVFTGTGTIQVKYRAGEF